MRLKWLESLPLRPIVVIASVSSTSPSCPHLYRLIAAIPSQTARSRPKFIPEMKAAGALHFAGFAGGVIAACLGCEILCLLTVHSQ